MLKASIDYQKVVYDDLYFVKILIFICKSNTIIVHQTNNLYVYTFFDAT